MEDKKVLLSIEDLVVKFGVRGRQLTAIRGISLDIYENESIAIVGESGSGKSVFTKTFAGMLDENGYIDSGSIIFNDDTLADTKVVLGKTGKRLVRMAERKLNERSKFELGAATYREIAELESLKRQRTMLSEEESDRIDVELDDLRFRYTEAFNLKQTIDGHKEKERLKAVSQEMAELDKEIKALEADKAAIIRKHKTAAKLDSDFNLKYRAKHAELKARWCKEISGEISDETRNRNKILAKEIYLSVGRYPFFKRFTLINKLIKALGKAMKIGTDLSGENARNAVFDNVVFRVRYLDEENDILHGTCVINLAKVKASQDWSQIRGGRIATVFQDPMTSLNPIITIGKQITSVILKHQNCSETEARSRALELMRKVGIPNADKRFDDYPFQYSGGMRQRIVIAIALSCQPKILICDEPTTALDVTIQAQILKLIKDLQKEFGYTIVFITHDLGVVANIADRIAVLYAGQIVELGTVEDVFYDPRHPYTWALLSSLPQLAQRNTKLYSITGTPPSLYNKIVGDPFAPRNPHCLKIDTLKEPPMFKVTDTHYAKTWLLDPRAPKVEKNEAIVNIHEKLMKTFNI